MDQRLNLKKQYGLNDGANSIEIWSRQIRRSGYMFRHFWIELPEIGLEIHPGNYFLGSFHNIGTTKYGTLFAETLLCGNCALDLIENIHYTSDVWYFPLINCESITRGLCGDTPVSWQVLITTLAITCIVLSLIWFPILIIGLILFTILVITNEILPRAVLTTKYRSCIHLYNEK